MRTRLIHAAISAAALGALASCRSDSISSPSKDGVISANQVTEGSSVSYKYLIGVGMETPDVAVTPNGDQIALAGKGTFTLHPKSISGSGSYTASDGTAGGSGTWTATELLSFNSYGGPAGSDFEGGLALISVHLSPAGGGPGFDAVLEVSCLVGSPPPSADEGIRLAVESGPNFNTPVSGHTLFIRQ